MRCFMLLGGVSGTVFDYPTTLGMLGLRDQLVAAGFQVTVDPWGMWREVDHDIAVLRQASPLTLIIVIGYSGGASYATWMQSQIDLLIGYDPSPAGNVRELRPSVKKALCYHNNHPALWWPGIGWLGAGRYVGPQVTTVEINGGKGEFHLAVCYDASATCPNDSGV